MNFEDQIRKAYQAFNARDIAGALTEMHPDVRWPRAFEGGYVHGHEAVRVYWTRQWTEIDPHVDPVSFNTRQDGRREVSVHQLVKDLSGNILFDGIVKHLYTTRDGLMLQMDVEAPEV